MRSLLCYPLSHSMAHKSVLVGDLKFVVFKHFRANKGLQVEFAGGALQCGEYITVRKIGDSNQKGSTASQQFVVGRTRTRSASYFIHNSSCFRGDPHGAAPLLPLTSE